MVSRSFFSKPNAILRGVSIAASKIFQEHWQGGIERATISLLVAEYVCMFLDTADVALLGCVWIMVNVAVKNGRVLG